MLDTKVIVNVVIGLIIFRVLDKMVFSKIEFLSSFEAENYEDLED